MESQELPFFFVFPDREDAREPAERAQRQATGARVLRHPSGRPWIVGRWDDHEFLLARAGSTMLALAGTFDLDQAELTRRAALTRSAADLCTTTRSWPGSFHLVASVDGETLVRGTAYGSRRVFTTRVGDAVLAGDRAAALAALVNAPVDRGAVALRLVQPLPVELAERAMWQGIEAVRPGEYLLAHSTGGATRNRWHHPPTPDLPLEAGAARTRTALATAVSVRTAGGGTVSLDLSGGLDSTSLCFLASRHANGANLLACTLLLDERVNDDGVWTRRALEQLPDLGHLMVPTADVPLFYEGAFDPRDRWDFPSRITLSRRRAVVAQTLMAAKGSRLHLTGNGGDHLFFGAPNHFHATALRHPLLTLSRLRGYRALDSWRWRAVLAQLTDRRGYRAWLAGLTVRDSTPMAPDTPRLRWTAPLQVPSWLTPDCLDLIDTELQAAARTAHPLASTPGTHAELADIRSSTEDMRALDDISRLAGVPTTHPYFDDHVVDAALSVRIEDRVTPWRYRPLQVAALRGIVPPRSLSRATKAEATQDAELGLIRHREELVALWTNAALGHQGLVDANAVRRIVTSPTSPELRDQGLMTTLMTETWLRSATTSAW
ncbi:MULTISPECIES: asparagine synthase-related protein [unclassified Crossiella]|uniref:asparagine synthase-related protein n=1 Tax=unclassified Crossiella TaxID=2620835 RepID=UPI001FFF9E38|nr:MULTISPECIES: asparagine synthase-related protein [unclassified Crossiella]MCK2241834.1 asparagine synthase-related protein [Crossiella sp. S99.2]MCK2255737.1 asparagine synthase-related protein [Crossiella sp. S99.1]